jgi:hypothetical protein
MVTVNPLSILFSFLSSCSGLLNSDGTISYILLHVVIAGKCSPNQSASSANFGSTLTLDYLNTLVEALSPNLSSRSPQSLEDAVNIISEVSAGLRMPLVIRDNDLISPELGVCDSGLSTLLTLGTGNASTQKFWIASCLVGGAGRVVDRYHASNDALRYLDHETFSRLVPEHARDFTDVNLATLMLVWNSFLSFQYLPYPQIPTSIPQLMAITSDDIALRLGNQDVFSCYMSAYIQVMIPPPVHLQQLTANVRSVDVPTVVAAVKTFIFSDSLQGKPNTVALLHTLNDRLTSYAHLIPKDEFVEGVKVLSLHDALARVSIISDRQRSRADFGTTRSSGSSDSSGLPSGGAFSRQIADSVASVQHILDDILAHASDSAQQERIVKAVVRAQSSLLTYGLTKLPSPTISANVPALPKLFAIKHAISRVVAQELIKETGLDEELAVSALADALPSSILLGFLDGSQLNVANLLICFNAYKQVRIPGCRIYTLKDTLSNVSHIRAFILVVVKLLSALGLHGENLMTLVDLSITIEDSIPSASLFKLLDNVIPPSLHASLDRYSASIKAWLVSLSSAPIGYLVVDDAKILAAIKAVNKDRKRDLSQFGLDPGLFAPGKLALHQDSSSSSSSSSLPSALKRKAQDHRSVELHPGKSDRRAKSSSSSSSSKAWKSHSADPVDLPRQVVVRSPSSPLSPSLPRLVQCASGTVSHWGRDYVLVTQMLKAFRDQFPKLQALPDLDLLPVLLTAKTGEASFLRYVPAHASESLKRALRIWYDKKEFKKYLTEEPPDFR